jgi:hypothetical protein
LGESLDGEFVALTAISDTSPYTGRPYITGINPAQFHLSAGASQAVSVQITVPTSVGLDTHYAALSVSSKPPTDPGGSVSSNVSILVPVELTPVGAVMRLTGIIESESALVAPGGRSVQLTAVVLNTGNRHYHAQAYFTLYGAGGQVLATLTTAGGGTSLIPTFPRALAGTYTVPAGSPPLAQAEQDTLQVRVQLDDGSWLPPLLGSAQHLVYLPFVDNNSQPALGSTKYPVFLPYVGNASQGSAALGAAGDGGAAGQPRGEGGGPALKGTVAPLQTTIVPIKRRRRVSLEDTSAGVAYDDPAADLQGVAGNPAEAGPVAALAWAQAGLTDALQLALAGGQAAWDEFVTNVSALWGSLAGATS